MQIPPEVTFRGMDHSEAMEGKIRERAQKLDRFYDRIMSCRVVVEAPHRNHHKGKIYHVSLDVTVPGSELVVNRDPKDNHAHEDAYVAIRDAFDAMERKLEGFATKKRGDVKAHQEEGYARVANVSPEQDFGMLQSFDGRAIYFHRNSVKNGDFAKLKEGDEVRFLEEMGEEGPQAVVVRVIGEEHPEK
ncbi:MAG TPA: HPF/RaiA family ribosome-associated protein [Gammaproteobacteria bacterium]|nr:HPF/RaiA family ribosome-associated protein [Gammaproteobacteria bacterium]